MKRQAVLRGIIYAALFVFFTVLFMPLNYPSGKLTDQVNRFMSGASDGILTVANARIRPPFSLKLEGVTLKLEQGPLDMGTAVVGPRLMGLLFGKRGADIRLENPWVNSSLTFISAGEGWDLDVRNIEIDLAELPEVIMPIPLRLEGEIGMSLNLLARDSSQGISDGEVRITSGPVEIGGDLLETLGLAPLRISRILAVATVKENVLELGETAIEGDVSAAARGVVRIAPVNYMASRVDLTVEVKLSPGSRERLMPVFTLMGARPRADGSVNLRIRGTVGEPSITM